MLCVKIERLCYFMHAVSFLSESLGVDDRFYLF